MRRVLEANLQLQRAWALLYEPCTCLPMSMNLHRRPSPCGCRLGAVGKAVDDVNLALAELAV